MAYRATRFALHVLMDGQLRAANSAKYCLLVPLGPRPNLNGVIGEGVVALFARIVNATTFHLYSDDVGGSVIMLATGLRIKVDAAHVRMIWKHGANQEKRGRVNLPTQC
jgi:hypothetical protein